MESNAAQFDYAVGPYVKSDIAAKTHAGFLAINLSDHNTQSQS
jgi:hypothetical protein